MIKRNGFVAILMVMLGASTAGAADVYLDLDCWVAPTTSPNWATPADEETASATLTQSRGFNFGSTDSEIIECSIQLPADTPSGATPSVVINGWATANHACSTDLNVWFEVESKAIADGQSLTAPWVTGGADNVLLDCPGFFPFIIISDVLFQLELDATNAPGDWSALDWIVIKIERLASDSADDYPHDVHVNKVQLRYSY